MSGLAGLGAIALVGLVLWNPAWIDGRATAIEASALLALVIITAVYAFLTHQIGERTAAAVEEARRARQDAYRPFLDIQGRPDSKEKISFGLMKRDDPDSVPKYVTCELKNVGYGPAFWVQLHVNFDESSPSNRRVIPVPTMMVGDEIVDLSGPRPAGAEQTSVAGHPGWSPLRLRVEPLEDDPGKGVGIRVEYRDVFGRRFASRKSFASDSDDFLGALEIIEMEPESAGSEATGERR